jgi:DNA-binding CsgD family transcriptional regulator/tetratricopeptide (TPR) repeat protein
VRMLEMAEAGPLDDLERARAQLLRAQITFAVTRGSEAPALLLEAAQRLEPLDARLARETYLDAFSAALSAGRLARDGDMNAVARAVRSANWGSSPRHSPDACELLLKGLAVLTTEGHAASVPTLKQALRAFRIEPMSEEDALRWLWPACRIARALGDDATWDVLTARHVKIAREAGALSELPLALNSRAFVDLFAGDLAAAAALVVEAEAVIEATGSQLAPQAAISLAAWRGQEVEVGELIEASLKEVVPRGEGIAVTVTQWASAVLFNGLGRYEEALVAAERAADHRPEKGEAAAATHGRVAMNTMSTWVSPELIEAAVRSGQADRAAGALSRLAEIASASGTDWARGIEARSRALASEGEDAEGLYREAIERLGRTSIRVELARGRLLYGEWLRREHRRVDAREQLRGAHSMYAEMGMMGFAERARGELLATGETVRKRTVDTRNDLTPQEVQIARLAGEGRTNSEIAAQLFISARTVEWHLRKVFPKLGISSRRQLRPARFDSRLSVGPN